MKSEDVISCFDVLKNYMAYQLGENGIPVFNVKWIQRLAIRNKLSAAELVDKEIINLFDAIQPKLLHVVTEVRNS
ncbi:MULTISPECIES: hypothetical protein [Lacticaseibacillus]|uniref:hypothetical protein n=1 Tax=Lacticaseibacillus TaxID=2759736 RepID=UPI000469F333|nr:hypothetical protein [Lacticaseibacillus casei]MBI6598033.1 hypothetical protein [Lacticaseibacillus casei]MBO1481739.1 hypothetical protein [Lacticaseibacillus casei]MBO2417019.1 hypothetical protein [Lacticaseibacillus casei]MCK2081408.1 hypothetical protein [Lacticaseibacillus casei]MDZ5496156.1 hypothetical protein [Lacticaseibacillus casei]